MPGFALALDTGVQCTHLAPGSIAPGQTRVLLGGQPAATTANTITVAGCLFQVPAPTPSGTKPSPCVSITWGSVAGQVTADGAALLLGTVGTVAGTCRTVEQVAQGTPAVTAVQTKVSAT